MTVHLRLGASQASGAALSRRFAAVVAVVVAGIVTIGGATTASAADYAVQQGGSIQILVGEQVSNVRVRPPEAGTATFVPVQPGVVIALVEFTASATFSGIATVSWSATLGTLGNTVQVQGPQATASGSFTPVAAPGPCIVITSNPVVSFGDVTIGGDFTSTPAPPSVAGCSPTSVRQDVLVQTSSATNGPATLDPACGGATPATCIPADGFFAVGIPGDALIVGPTPSLWLDARAGDFPDQAAGLAVRMPPTLAPTFVGSVFTFDVTFTAVID